MYLIQTFLKNPRDFTIIHVLKRFVKQTLSIASTIEIAVWEHREAWKLDAITLET